MQPNKNFAGLPKRNPLTRSLAISAIINLAIIYLLVIITGYFRIMYVIDGPQFSSSLLLPIAPLEYAVRRKSEPATKVSTTRAVLQTKRYVLMPETVVVEPKQHATIPAITTKPTVATVRTETTITKHPDKGVKLGTFGDPVGVPINHAATNPPTIPAQGAQGFSSGNHESPSGNGHHGQVKLAGIGSGTTYQSPVPRGKITTALLPNTMETTPTSAPVTGTHKTDVKVLDHPMPAYTREAEKLRIAGQVVLLVQFGASGKTTVLSVVSGLGHGLDEEAVQVAENTKFTPATVNGKNVDVVTHYRVDFQTLN